MAAELLDYGRRSGLGCHRECLLSSVESRPRTVFWEFLHQHRPASRCQPGTGVHPPPAYAESQGPKVNRGAEEAAILQAGATAGECQVRLPPLVLVHRPDFQSRRVVVDRGKGGLALDRSEG